MDFAFQVSYKLAMSSSLTDNYTPADVQTLSAKFRAARLQALSLDRVPGSLPPTLEAAYCVQDASITEWPDAVAGWKVGGIPSALQQQLGAAHLSGPIFRRGVLPVRPAESTAFPAFEGGFSAFEAELVLVIARDVPPEVRSWSEEQARELIAEVRIAVETAGSPLASINEVGPLAVVSDFGNNAGLILGERVADWRDHDEKELTCEVTVDETPVGQATLAPMLRGAIPALIFLLGNLARRGRTLEAGAYVSTGAITGIHSMTIGQRARAVFGALGEVRGHAVAAKAAR